ncbi:S41 family peptidase [Plebeiibacterium sediminum]|uniref:S41 family peptidase n=1 Tax=Plebeiibacterium sediminum TaxID=2992112 RepID=A0AAE3M483_9BACT|nr:S41 family peptidase [Plebeiobacterium sediminum]MCW3786515.1 S41 family peptidase [Plebeiobacterium sediminum]
MIKLKDIIVVLLFMVITYSCTDNLFNEEEGYLNTFQSFWDILNERYVFFKEKSVDWDAVYENYYTKFEKVTSDQEAKKLYQEIIDLFHDRHVRISINNDYGISYESELEVPEISFGMVYGFYYLTNLKEYDSLHLGQLPNKIAYLRVLNNFKGISGSSLPLSDYNYENGFVLDLRDCIGGYTTGLELLDIFIDATRIAYYEQYRNGINRQDFTRKFSVVLNGKGIISNSIPKVVLINDNTYSMGNFMASVLKDLTNSTFVGQKTGGGGGTINSVYLPNGWGLTYTFTKIYNLEGQTIEDGINPDVEVIRNNDFWENEHRETGIDPQLEKALEVLQRND